MQSESVDRGFSDFWADKVWLKHASDTLDAAMVDQAEDPFDMVEVVRDIRGQLYPLRTLCFNLYWL